MAQENSENPYSPKDMGQFEVYIERITQQFTQRITGEHSKKIKKRFKDRPESILETIKDSTYFFEAVLNNNLETILSRIYRTNPAIDTTDFKFLIKNSIVPNAGAYGDGLFEINIGLLTLYKTEDELAMVICHEIAHKELNHSIKRIVKIAGEFYSKETKAATKKIKRLKYGQTRASLALLDEMQLDILEHSRDAEAEADSLGMIYFRNAGFNEAAGIKALEKLDTVDDQLLSFPVKLDSLFDFESLPFKKYWLEEEISLFDIDEKINDFSYKSDTVKTHPEITYRVQKLKDEFFISKVNSQPIIPLSEIRSIAFTQSLQYTLDRKRYDLSIYLISELYDNKNISTQEYYGNLANVLMLIHKAKEDHTLGKSIPPYNKYADEKQLNNIRLFLQNIELRELKKLGITFCKTYEQESKNKSLFKEAYTYFNN